MSELSAFEAQANLPRLLKRVQAGERFVITRHNRPVAEWIPFKERNVGRIRNAIDDLKAFRKRTVLEGSQCGR